MNQLTHTIGKKVLQSRFSKTERNKCVQNFETASQAVILFDTDLPQCFAPIKDFAKFLNQQDIKTSILGYVPQKDVPQEMLLWANIEFLTRKDVSWFGSPKGAVVETFFKKEPDILFVISFRDILTIEYLTKLSRAKFKVGCYTEKENDLDFMINSANKDCTVEFFIEQVKHYITLLNPSK